MREKKFKKVWVDITGACPSAQLGIMFPNGSYGNVVDLKEEVRIGGAEVWG